MMDEPEVGELWTNDTSDFIYRVIGIYSAAGVLADEHDRIVVVSMGNLVEAWDYDEFVEEHTYRSKAHEE